MTPPFARHLVVMAKAPRLGRAKRRLARDIGPVAAWTFYRHALNVLLGRQGGKGCWRALLAVTPDRAATRLWRPRPGMEWGILAQGRGDLGIRMERVLRRLPPGPVVIIGSDIPEIGPHHIRRAFALLARHPAVLGPAPDGGYWLVGMRRAPMPRRPFAKVRWSGPHALADTLANLPGAVLMDAVLEDVDCGGSYDRCSVRRGIISTRLQGR